MSSSRTNSWTIFDRRLLTKVSSLAVSNTTDDEETMGDWAALVTQMVSAPLSRASCWVLTTSRALPLCEKARLISPRPSRDADIAWLLVSRGARQTMLRRLKPYWVSSAVIEEAPCP